MPYPREEVRERRLEHRLELRVEGFAEEASFAFWNVLVG
jgi:hypothetical protein